MGRLFAHDQGGPGFNPRSIIPKTQRMVLNTPCLTLSITSYVSRVKWCNPGKGVAHSPTPQCSSY